MTELDRLMDRIEGKYDVETAPMKIGEKVLSVLQFKDFEQYLVDLVEKQSLGILDLPYWGKIWESSFLLAYFLGKQKTNPSARMLEIGAGIGVVGVYAALCGHRVTITDINEDALMFAEANVLLNNAVLADVRKLDWKDANALDRYDVIVGSEVVYDRESYPLLVRFLRKSLAPGGYIFLAKNTELNAPAFFMELTKYFELKETVQKVRCGEEETRISLYAIRPKEGGLLME